MKNVTFEQMSDFILSRLDWVKDVKYIIIDELGDMDTNTEYIFEIDNKSFEIYRHDLIECEDGTFTCLYNVEQL